MRKLAKLRGKNWELEVWRGIADFANADLAGNQEALRAVDRLVRKCTPGFPSWDDTDSIADLIGKPANGQTLDQRFEQKAVEAQPILRLLLRWLARPQEKTLIPIDNVIGRPVMMVHPVDILNGELSSTYLQKPSSDTDFGETPGNGSYPFYFERVVKFHSLLGPICNFIVKEADDSIEQAPVRICEREGCGKFTVPERTGRKKFCSDQCRALSYQGSRTDWNKYMRDYRKTVKSKRKRGKK